MKSTRIGLRVSPELRALVERYGSVSAAAEALIILGAVALGADPGPLRVDVGHLLGEQLDAQVLARLRDVLNQCLPSGQRTFNAPEPEEPAFPVVGTPAEQHPAAASEVPELDDPFAVGIEV